MTTTVDEDWKIIEKPGANSYHVFTKPIIKSEQDDRDYRIIQLDNGLKVTLVHDAKADKAAASLDVAVGHLYDPHDMPGLAHFCEHLLFMGTEKFPRENEYSEFLAKNNGASNAYTSTSNTNYYFNVATSALPGALERFAAFFHCPLFAPSCTSRELNAVDSEHKKNHQTDLWRIFQLNKHLTRPGHVWSKFGSGNRDSLSKAARELKEQGKLLEREPSDNLLATPIPSGKASPAPSTASNSSEAEADGGPIGRETRRRLVEWWNKEYCASRMRLAIVGKESLEELANLANTLFSPIPNRGRDALPMIYEHPFGPEQKGTLISVQTIMAFHAVEISFPLEYQPPFWRYKPINFISHFVGHEGPGSLHSYLKNKHWVTSDSQTIVLSFWQPTNISPF
jgi:insulysin